MRALPLILPAVLLAFASGCASYLFAPPLSETDPAAEGDPDEVRRSDRFLGTWLVDQPFHAGYEASFYELDASGRLTHLFTDIAGGGLAGELEVGLVAIEEPCPSAVCPRVVCRFGETWRSDGSETLIVDGECDDGVARDIELTFEGPRAGNAEGLTQVEVTRVGDEVENVFHPGFEWRFLKCLDDAGEPLADQWGCEPLTR